MNLPKLECKGLCTHSCRMVLMGKSEEDVIRKKYGHVPQVDEDLSCTMLRGGRCAIYEDRPMVCRLWGMMERMVCPHGCIPDGGLLKYEDGRKILLEALAT